MSKRWNEYDAILLAQMQDDDLLPYSKQGEPPGDRPRVLPAATLYQYAHLAPILTVPENRTLVPVDQGRILLFTGERTVTLPDPSEANILVGFQAVIVNYGGDPITLVADTTLEARGNTLLEQYDHARVIHVGDDVWLALGDLTDMS